MSNWTNKKAAFSFPEQGYPGRMGKGGPLRSLHLVCTSTAAVGAGCPLCLTLGWVSTLLGLAHSALPGAREEGGQELTLPFAGSLHAGGAGRSARGPALHPWTAWLQTSPG